jgi:ribosomal protein S18 acetylase RimI-like enzyme
VEYELIEITPDEIGSLRTVMLSMHEAERQVQPALGHAPVRTDDDFWNLYTARFPGWFHNGDGFCIAARSPEGEILGHVFGVVKEGDIGFDSGDEIGYIEDIAVIEGARGAGLGSVLLDAARSRFAERGLRSFKLSTVPGNNDARRFYARHGLKPAAQLLIGEV